MQATVNCREVSAVKFFVIWHKKMKMCAHDGDYHAEMSGVYNVTWKEMISVKCPQPLKACKLCSDSSTKLYWNRDSNMNENSGHLSYLLKQLTSLSSCIEYGKLGDFPSRLLFSFTGMFFAPKRATVMFSVYHTKRPVFAATWINSYRVCPIWVLHSYQLKILYFCTLMQTNQPLSTLSQNRELHSNDDGGNTAVNLW